MLRRAQVAAAKPTKSGVVRRRLRSANLVSHGSPSGVSHPPPRAPCTPPITDTATRRENGRNTSKTLPLKSLRHRWRSPDEAADDTALHRRGHDRAEAERDFPDPGGPVHDLIAKIEGDTTQTQRQHHEMTAGRRPASKCHKRPEKPPAAQPGHDKPSLVSIPRGHDRVDHPVAQVFVGLARSKAPTPRSNPSSMYIERKRQCGE